jgi:hypothetical protein
MYSGPQSQRIFRPERSWQPAEGVADTLAQRLQRRPAIAERRHVPAHELVVEGAKRTGAGFRVEIGTFLSADASKLRHGLHLHVGRSRQTKLCRAEHIIELAKVAFALYSRRAPGYCSARLADEPADGYPSYTGETHPWS